MTNPSAYFAGTVDTDNELIIMGTGFGATEGTVFFLMRIQVGLVALQVRFLLI